ncbi:MAG: hypothetical protein ABIS24_00500 [Candidatus Saccharimonadales bacterium]
MSKNGIYLACTIGIGLAAIFAVFVLTLQSTMSYSWADRATEGFNSLVLLTALSTGVGFAIGHMTGKRGK